MIKVKVKGNIYSDINWGTWFDSWRAASIVCLHVGPIKKAFLQQQQQQQK